MIIKKFKKHGFITKFKEEKRKPQIQPKSQEDLQSPKKIKSEMFSNNSFQTNIFSGLNYWECNTMNQPGVFWVILQEAQHNFPYFGYNYPEFQNFYFW